MASTNDQPFYEQRGDAPFYDSVLAMCNIEL